MINKLSNKTVILEGKPYGAEFKFGPYDVTEPEQPTAGYLRYFLKNGGYIEMPYEAGQRYMLGDEDLKPSYNLNKVGTAYEFYYNDGEVTPIPKEVTFDATTSGGHMFAYAKNFTIPEGTTFNKITNANAMFYASNNIVLPEGVTFGATTKGTEMFRLAVNITLPETVTFENLTDATNMFYDADGINIPDSVTFASLTNLDHTFYRSARKVINNPIQLPDHLTFNSVTNGYVAFDRFTGHFPANLQLKNVTNGNAIFYQVASQVPDGVTLENNTNFYECFYGYYGRLPKSLNMRKCTDARRFAMTAWLNIDDLAIVANTIGNFVSGQKTIDLGIDKTLQNNTEVEAHLATIRNKGWTVVPVYNVRPATPPVY